MSEVQTWIDIAAQTTGVHGGYASPGASQAGNDGTLATFYYRQKQDEAATNREGRPIFIDVPYVEIRLPGQKNSVVDRAVKDEDKQRWPQAWQNFEQRQTGMVGGTPLSEWPYLTRTRVAELNAMGVHAVEQLAGLPEANASQLGPDGYDLMKRAQQFMQPDDETIGQLRQENKDLRARLEAVEAMVATKQAMPAVEQPPEPKPAPIPAPAPPSQAPVEQSGPAPAIVPEDWPGKAAINVESERRAPYRFRRIYQGFGVVDTSNDQVIEKFRTKGEAEARTNELLEQARIARQGQP